MDSEKYFSDRSISSLRFSWFWRRLCNAEEFASFRFGCNRDVFHCTLDTSIVLCEIEMFWPSDLNRHVPVSAMLPIKSRAEILSFRINQLYFQLHLYPSVPQMGIRGVPAWSLYLQLSPQRTLPQRMESGFVP